MFDILGTIHSESSFVLNLYIFYIVLWRNEKLAKDGNFNVLISLHDLLLATV